MHSVLTCVVHGRASVPASDSRHFASASISANAVAVRRIEMTRSAFELQATPLVLMVELFRTLGRGASQDVTPGRLQSCMTIRACDLSLNPRKWKHTAHGSPPSAGSTLHQLTFTINSLFAIGWSASILSALDPFDFIHDARTAELQLATLFRISVAPAPSLVSTSGRLSRWRAVHHPASSHTSRVIKRFDFLEDEVFDSPRCPTT